MKKKIMALCLAALSVAFTLTACGSQSGTTTKTITTTAKAEKSETSVEEKSEPAYSKGVVENKVYRNEWLNLMIRMPDNYKEATDEFYQELAQKSSDEYGMYFVSDQSATVSIGFADAANYPDVTAEDYLQAISEKFFASASDGVSISDFTIASKTFKYAHFPNTGTGMTNSTFAYRKGNKICYILITGPTVADNEKIAERFTTIS
ncbi:MAG: hypothetical protein ACI4XE_04650 [Acutalibacteraceae bacterium]